MPLSIEQALEQACALIIDTKTLVRVVLSGRRRNMQVEHERIDIRAVEIKGPLFYNSPTAMAKPQLLKILLQINQISYTYSLADMQISPWIAWMDL